MLSYITRKQLINEYFKWLLILEYIDEDKAEEDMVGGLE